MHRLHLADDGRCGRVSFMIDLYSYRCNRGDVPNPEWIYLQAYPLNVQGTNNHGH